MHLPVPLLGLVSAPGCHCILFGQTWWCRNRELVPTQHHRVEHQKFADTADFPETETWVLAHSPKRPWILDAPASSESACDRLSRSKSGSPVPTGPAHGRK